MDKPDCSRCNAPCCRIFWVNMEEGDNIDNYEKSSDGKYLKRIGDGSCIYLIDNKCSIYNKRPNICQNWSCYKDPRWYVIIENHLTGKSEYFDKSIVN